MFVADARGGVPRQMSRDAGRLRGGLNAPVSLLGLMSSVSKEHGGGTARRGRPEEEVPAWMEFFIFCVFGDLASHARAEGSRRAQNRKKFVALKLVVGRQKRYFLLLLQFSLSLPSAMRSLNRPRAAAKAPGHALVSRAAGSSSGARPAPSPGARVLLASTLSSSRRRFHHHHHRSNNLHLLRATLTPTASASLMRWLVEDKGMETPAAEPGASGGLIARRAIEKGEVRMRLMSSFFFVRPLSFVRPPSHPLLHLHHLHSNHQQRRRSSPSRGTSRSLPSTRRSTPRSARS